MALRGFAKAVPHTQSCVINTTAQLNSYAILERETIKLSELKMTNSTITKSQDESQDRAIWDNLREAIATSSGFQRWQQEQDVDSVNNLDLTVRRYLKETLETLAY